MGGLVAGGNYGGNNPLGNSKPYGAAVQPPPSYPGGNAPGMMYASGGTGVVSGFGGGAPSAPAQPYQAPPIANTAQANPDMQGFLGQYKNKLNTMLTRPNTDPNLQTQVDRLGRRMSSDTTQHAIQRAGGAIRDQGSAQQAALKTNLARRGIGGSGVGDQLSQNIDARTQRAQAGSASDISLGRERDLDALTLGGQGIMAAPGQYSMGRDNQDIGAIAGGVSAANPGAQLQLGQQQLGLQQWQAGQNQQGAQQDRAFAQWQALMHMYGS